MATSHLIIKRSILKSYFVLARPMKPGFHAFCDLNCEHQCHKRKLWWNKHKISTLKYDAMAYSIITGPLAAGNNNNINRNVNKHILLLYESLSTGGWGGQEEFSVVTQQKCASNQGPSLVKGPESSWVFNTATYILLLFWTYESVIS